MIVAIHGLRSTIRGLAQIHTLRPTYIGGERGVREREEGRWEREGGRGRAMLNDSAHINVQAI